MAIRQLFPLSFKLEVIEGVHNLASDTLKCALYSLDLGASLDQTVTAYTATGEISDASYTAGGQAVALQNGYPAIVGTSAQLWLQDLSWGPGSNISADGALIYNASKANRAVLVIAFAGRHTAAAGTFAIRFSAAPAPLIQIA